ncbi:MAG: histidinol-phosphate transaminase [Lachnospiraceae bacterium]|nr:histidinol-phosphate transaminase [Lachnospiraceae bacterium]
MSEWEKNVRRVIPYVPGEQPADVNVIKLNTNENPYPPAPAVCEAVKKFDTSVLRKYPAPDAKRLVAALSDAFEIPEDQIFVGVGSDDVLAMSVLTFFNGKKPVLMADVTYSFYDVWAELFRIPYESIPLNGDFRYELSDYLRPNGGVVIANPNAPTALVEPKEFFEELLEKNPSSVVIVDEAYGDFYGWSAKGLLDRYENLLVVGTFSKSRSLAGSRIGFAFGSRKLISYLNDVKFSFNSYTMDAITLAVGEAALSPRSREYYHTMTEMIIATRESAKKRLAGLGFTCTDSRANFVFATHSVIPAKEIFEKLKEHKIYVRYFDKPRIDNYLRITIGTDDEMTELYKALEEIGCRQS